MKLTTETLGGFDDPSAESLARLFRDDAFGKFAVRSRANGAWLQTATAWAPDDACAAFVREHGSDPWVLEHREHVCDLFKARANGASTWSKSVFWVPVEE